MGVKYGNSELQGKFVLGPMAAYTDIAFRLVCRQAGAAMCFTEFANSQGIIRDIPPTMKLIRTVEEEMPVGIQIFGPDESTISQSAAKISAMIDKRELFASCIDLNFGCPSGTVTRAGGGAALLKNPDKMAGIVKACVDASSVPITAKIRAGWSSDNSIEIAKKLEKAGAVGITVHWRTATEGRKRMSGWEVVGEVKKQLGITVIGNGGASTPERSVQFLQETSCDAVMISSAALGYPGIFRRANSLFEGKEMPPMSWEERKADFEAYHSYAKKFGVLEPKSLRQHAIEFLAGFPGVKEARTKLNFAKTVDEITELMRNFAPTEAPLT